MGLLAKLGFGPKEAVDAAGTLITTTADTVERWLPGEKAKHDMSREDVADSQKGAADARAYDPKSELQGNGVLQSIINSVNVLVDAANRLVRPTLTFTLMGSLFGWWDVKLNTEDPLMVKMSLAVFGFYFGVRGMTEDLPRIIKGLRDARKG